MKIRALALFAAALFPGTLIQASASTLYGLALDAEELSAAATWEETGVMTSGLLASSMAGLEAPGTTVSTKEMLAGTQFTLGGIEFDAGPFQVLNNPESSANWLALTMYRGFDAANLREINNIGSDPLAP